MARSGSTGRGTLIGVVDAGTSKIVCLVLEARPATRSSPAQLRSLGLGHHRSAGIEGGVVTDPAALEAAIRQTVAAAEHSARQRLEEVYVSVSCGRLASKTFLAKADIGGRAVNRADIDRLHQGAVAYAEGDGRMLIHMNRRGYRLDGVRSGGDPRGMAAGELGADIHAVTADESPVCNLIHAVELADLDVAGLIAAPYASGLAVTTPAERELGAVVVDLGAGTTGIAVFADGQFVHTELLAIGGSHLTFEIAKKFRATLAEAERIKALYASMVNARSGLGDRFSYVLAGSPGETMESGSMSDLDNVVEHSITEVARIIDGRRRKLGANAMPVVLTGGGSGLIGIAEFLGRALEAEVRVGRTAVLPGMPVGSERAVFATAVGLAKAAVEGSRIDLRGAVRGGYLASVGRWLAGV